MSTDTEHALLKESLNNATAVYSTSLVALLPTTGQGTEDQQYLAGCMLNSSRSFTYNNPQTEALDEFRKKIENELKVKIGGHENLFGVDFSWVSVAFEGTLVDGVQGNVVLTGKCTVTRPGPKTNSQFYASVRLESKPFVFKREGVWASKDPKACKAWDEVVHYEVRSLDVFTHLAWIVWILNQSGADC